MNSTFNDPDRSEKTLLIVDDERDLAEILAESLTYAGYTVETARDAHEALDRLEQQEFDLLLTDIHMPKMRGDELQRLARERYPDLVVLMVTAATDLSVAVQCMKEGVYDYIPKPFDLQDVTLRVEKALERRRLVLENRAHQATLERQVAAQAERIRGMFQDSLQALNYTLEAKDEYTSGHSWRVANIATEIARELRPDDTEFHHRLRIAALLHDIGKIGVPEAVLLKPDKLTDEEFTAIKKHPVIGEIILRPLFQDNETLADVRHHHEQWNGRGYPDGLVAEQIPLGARIIAVADSYDAMTSARAYRSGMPHEKAMGILQSGAGAQWDAQVVAAIVHLAESGWLQASVTRSEVVPAIVGELQGHAA